MYGPDDSERTAFRRAEKQYKLYYDQGSRSSKKKKQPKQVDLSEVIDFKCILESNNQNGELPSGVFALKRNLDQPVFCLENRPGFYFIPGALSVEEQCRWIRESLTSFPQPPNRTNHNAIYGPLHDLFNASKDVKVLVEEDGSTTILDSESNPPVGSGEEKKWVFTEEHVVSSKGNTCKSISAAILLRKLRWSTLGLQFDWSERNYDMSLPHNKIPELLCQLAKRMALPAMPFGEEFQPEAAIVNYFGLGDALGGHLDDMEQDWSKPIVSMSLGCKAIFLLGGKTRQDPPSAMFLRSGDVVLMAGEARECFHETYFMARKLVTFLSDVYLESSPTKKMRRSLLLSCISNTKTTLVTWSTSELQELISTSDKCSEEGDVPTKDKSNYQIERDASYDLVCQPGKEKNTRNTE